jgi:hypothetical protein
MIRRAVAFALDNTLADSKSPIRPRGCRRAANGDRSLAAPISVEAIPLSPDARAEYFLPPAEAAESAEREDDQHDDQDQ